MTQSLSSKTSHFKLASDKLSQDLADNRLSEWAKVLQSSIEVVINARQHGQWQEWQQLMDELPIIPSCQAHLNESAIRVSSEQALTDNEQTTLINALKALHPWRKGPYQLFDTYIDTEWHSDWKWDRVAPHLSPLTNRSVLDIGCGNGYHAWRMLGAGARLVIGADPSQFFFHQFHLMKHFMGKDLPIHLIPLKSEEITGLTKHKFDTVFSMGVLYHRRSPIDHLYELKSFLRPGGELLLETLVIDGDDQQVLVPEERYAKMRNVWFIPTPELMCRWLARAGFINIRVIDITATTVKEQRATEWMQFESLPDFLDPNNEHLTVEGYPAPVRASFLCQLP